MSQALYRKYRPKSLDDVAGQNHITKTLSSAINSRKISHAYLFTGPRGVGKTSVARILAHAINSLPYREESTHIDIIEIDAASNRKIDEIRDLREKVHMAPISAKYKVYIIDEVHMLTKESFNALLKTLEEPPSHVIFILATTDAHKLPETIISRTQWYSFKPISETQITAQLKLISKKEKIKITDEALKLISEYGRGSLRDSVSILDQASTIAKGEIGINDITELLGLPPKYTTNELIDLILKGGSISEILTKLSSLYDQGYDPALISKELSGRLRTLLVEGANIDMSTDLELLNKLIQTPASYDPKTYLEISLLDSVKISDKATVSVAVPETDIKTPRQNETSRIPNINLEISTWPEVLNALKAKHNTLYSIVRMAEPKFTNDQVTLNFEFEFHVKRLNESNNRKMLIQILKDLTGKDFQIVLNHKMSKTGGQSVNKDDLDKVSAIFNGAKLLES